MEATKKSNKSRNKYRMNQYQTVDKKVQRNNRNTTPSSPLSPVDTSSPIGTCYSMCPLNELKLRTEHNELSQFEKFNDGVWAVKKYRRAAAGRETTNVSELRPPKVLLDTLDHLFQQILPWENGGFQWGSLGTRTVKEFDLATNFLALYNFLSDRIRSVKQDFIIQNIRSSEYIRALEQIARFYILASAQAKVILVVNHENDWSETMNNQQLNATLSELHTLYSYEHLHGASKNRPEFLAYSICLHLNDAHTVNFLLRKHDPLIYQNEPLLQQILRIFVAYHTSDYYTFFQSVEKSFVCPLINILLTRHYPKMWEASIAGLTKAYWRNDSFAFEELSHMWKVLDIEHLQILCRGMNVDTKYEKKCTNTSAERIDDSWESISDQDILIKDDISRWSANFKTAPLNSQLDSSASTHLQVHLIRYIQNNEQIWQYTSPAMIVQV